jgi:uncharacterized protein YdhG (YjbR/CyaY superfamily)
MMLLPGVRAESSRRSFSERTDRSDFASRTCSACANLPPRFEAPVRVRCGTLVQATAFILRTVKLPILSFEGNDLIVFETAEEAQAFVEPSDIQVADTYDATGRVLRFETDGRLTSLIETDEVQPDDLRTRLLEVFAATEVATSQDALLDELVAEASRRLLDSRR